jgi:tetratricopeptide (TPR) repeat protein
LIESWSAEAQGSTVADLFVRLGNLYAQWKKYELAEDAYHEALERLSPNHLPDDPTVTAALQNLAVLYLRQGEGDKSINLYLKLFDWLDKHQKDTSPAARAHMELALANIYFQQGILTSSEKWYLAALQRMTGALSQQFDFGSAHQDLGELYQKLGRIEEAKKHLRQAIDSKERTFGIRHPGVAAIQATLADLYSRQGNYDKAIELLAIALDTFRTSLGSEHQTVIDLNTRLRTIKASKS